MRTVLYFAVVLGGFLVFLAHYPNLLLGQPAVGYTGEDPASLLSHLVTTTSAVGAVVVFLVYWFRFSQWTGPDAAPAGFRPHPTRHSTTWVRYILWASLYAGIMVGIYVLIILFPQVLVNLTPALQSLGIELPFLSEMRQLVDSGNPSPDALVPYALIVTLLAWGELVEKPEKHFRGRMQELALIPTEGKTLVARLGSKDAPFKSDSDAVETMMKEGKFGDHLLATTDFTSEHGLPAMFARCAYLREELQILFTQRLKNVAARHEKELVEIGEEFDAVAASLQQFRADQIDYLTDLGKEDPDLAQALADNENGGGLFLADLQQLVEDHGKKRPYAKDYFDANEKDIHSRLSYVLTRLYQVAVCSVLASGRSPGSRKALFRTLGFEIDDPLGVRMSRETLARAFLTLLATIFLSSVVYYLLFGVRIDEAATDPARISKLVPGSVSQVVAWTLWGCLMHLLGVLGGYLMERSHEIVRSGEPSGGRRGASGLSEYARIADSFESFALGTTLNVFLFALVALAASDWGAALQKTWSWALVPGVTGAFTGFYMQRLHRRPHMRWLLALVQGLATTLVVGIVLLWIFDPQLRAGGDLDADALDFSVYAIITGMIVGTALGFVLQDWVYRERLGLLEERRRDKRRHVKIIGEWSSMQTSCDVQLCDMSKGGVRLLARPPEGYFARICRRLCPWLVKRDTRLPESIGTEGKLTLHNGKHFEGRVVRHIKDRFSCLEFADGSPVVAG